MAALTEDHFNDVLSNGFAIITAGTFFVHTHRKNLSDSVVCKGIAGKFSRLWWVDPAGAIIFSTVIIGRWFYIVDEQVKKVAKVSDQH